MKWMNVVTKLLLGTILLSSLVACGGSATTRSTGTYFDDAGITTRVKTALIGNSETAARNISVETYKGVVQLSGFVQSEHQKNQAEKIARDVDGVIRVQNDLLIR